MGVSQRSQFDKDTMIAIGHRQGIITDNVNESTSKASPLPLIGGSYGNDTKRWASESKQAASMTAGRISLVGPQDGATGLDVAGGWLWRAIRTVVTGQVYKKAIDGITSTTNAKTAADVTKNSDKLNASTATTLAKERGKLIPKVNPELVPVEALKSP